MKKIACAVLLLVISAVDLSPAGDVRGWRGDASGCYPAASPPLHWSKTSNVVWSIRTPRFSNATPLLVGNRLWVCSEPSTLICLNADNGQILWQRTNEYDDVLSPSEIEQAKLIYTNLSTRPRTHDVTGFSSPTPVSDGRRVYAVFGNGVAACYELDGTRVWARLVERPSHEWGHSSSPLLSGGVLIVHVLKMTALEAATGKVLWAAETPPSWGTSVFATLGDAVVVITPKGDVFDISNGGQLARRVSKLDYCAPLVVGNTAYFIENGGKALRLPSSVAKPFQVETLWQTRPAAERYYASPVLYKNRLYAVNRKGNFSIIDAATGAVVSEQTLSLGGTYYPSITLAGHYLFVSSDEGVTVVFDADDSCREISRNTLEPFRSSPVFNGTRLYIRTLNGVFCLGQ